MRLWVEILFLHFLLLYQFRQPPCEAVSWNTESQLQQLRNDRQPPCEAVSWNIENNLMEKVSSSQPPCEAVSWNTIRIKEHTRPFRVSLLVRLWVEISSTSHIFCHDHVSLLVRLWVEMSVISYLSWSCTVSLLVRLWVEICGDIS